MVKGIDEKAVKAYYNFMVDNAVIFGADKTRAEKEMRDALEFEMKLANVCVVSDLRHYFFVKKVCQFMNLNHLNVVIRFRWHVRIVVMQPHCIIHTQ